LRLLLHFFYGGPIVMTATQAKNIPIIKLRPGQAAFYVITIHLAPWWRRAYLFWLKWKK